MISDAVLLLALVPSVAAILTPPPTTSATVVFLRHGQSTWNAASLFTGWANVELSTLGKNEAAKAATELWKAGLRFDVAYSSRLTRARQTLDLVLRISGQENVPQNRCWRLNERMYGGLTGLNKKETTAQYGEDQVKVWRRSFDTPPPEVDLDSKYWPGNDPEYYHIPQEELPRSESLKDCIERTLPYWYSDITPALQRGKTVLVAAHGNSIRGLLKHLDGIPDDEITELEIPTGVPLVYHLDSELRPIRSERASGRLSGEFLADPEEVKAAQAAVAAQTAVRYGEEDTKDEVQFLCVGSGCLMLSTSELEATFANIDANGDGQISRDELKQATIALTEAADGEEEEQLTDEEIDTMFNMVDRDRNGVIDFAEFVRQLVSIPRPLGRCCHCLLALLANPEVRGSKLAAAGPGRDRREEVTLSWQAVEGNLAVEGRGL